MRAVLSRADFAMRAYLGGVIIIALINQSPHLAAETRRGDFMLGVDANYALDMEARGSRCYPLTPDGQSLWLSDFLKFCHNNPRIAGAFYWSPEWYGEGMWKAFALFDVEGNARSAWQAFRAVESPSVNHP